MEVDLNPSGLIIQEARGCYEIILPADHGPELWDYLLEAGAPYDLACVGHDALDRLAASHRFDSRVARRRAAPGRARSSRRSSVRRSVASCVGRACSRSSFPAGVSAL